MGSSNSATLTDYLVEHEAIKETPSFFDFLGLDKHAAYLLGIQLEHWIPVAMAAIVGLLLVGMSWAGTRRLEKIPGRFQTFLEMVVV